MFLHVKDKGLIINLDRFDTIELSKTADGKFDLSVVRFEGQLKLSTLIDKFERESDALQLQYQIVERLCYSDHVITIQKDYLGRMNNLGIKGQSEK